MSRWVIGVVNRSDETGVEQAERRSGGGLLNGLLNALLSGLVTHVRLYRLFVADRAVCRLDRGLNGDNTLREAVRAIGSAITRDHGAPLLNQFCARAQKTFDGIVLFHDRATRAVVWLG